MKFIIIGKNIDVTPGLKDAVESKLGKLQRYFTPDTEIHVTLSVQKEHQKIEVTIPVKGNIIRSEQESDDMYVSIDLVEEVIERQLRKYKNKLVAKNQEGNNFSKTLFETEESIEDDEVKIVRTKRFGIKPMYPEDARHGNNKNERRVFTFSSRSCYFYVWRLPWPRGSIAASRLLLVAFFCMATAMAERQRRRNFALTPLSAAPHQSVRTSTHRLLPFLLFH